MTTPTVTWCDYEGFRMPTRRSTIKYAETVCMAAAQDIRSSGYIMIKIHDPLHRSADQREHVTVRLKSQKQIDEGTYDTAHIYVDKTSVYCKDISIYKNNESDLKQNNKNTKKNRRIKMKSKIRNKNKTTT
ncbi:hypothetical protein K505DRAFT_360230 [Melanomma pulvis-pyrius CBS 109.77]|uniref:Uncharacterized protein n=1 Tax=Melanomma pulvis-pyrius CBS 109.77 TaxID=1314802 RepID=A0A6A6XHN1_9PLEO|nr:hypothetical protein K505DRAFT_360230 [Melanomma pulvis-pyrius CBS 109.77]